MGEHTATPYSTKYMKLKLENHYGQDVTMLCYPGKKTVVLLQMSAENILKVFYSSRKQLVDQGKLHIKRTAAQLILGDIKSSSKCQGGEVYPSVESLETPSSVIPNSLKTFLATLMDHKTDNLKQSAIGHAIMQAARPKALMMPMQLFLGVHLHNQLGKKNIVDEIASLGFCKPYKEVQKFLSNAALSLETPEIKLSCNENIQFVADNVDWDRDTLDGKNTVHWMGQIAIMNPFKLHHRIVPRRKITTDEIAEISSGIIPEFNPQQVSELKGLTFKKVLLEPYEDPNKLADFFLHMSPTCTK